jgi:hypothetical protein
LRKCDVTERARDQHPPDTSRRERKRDGTLRTHEA